MPVAPAHARIVPFDALSLTDLYALLALRQQVFCVEQHCPYQDVDFLDQSAWHVLLEAPLNNTLQLAAYARVLPPGSVHERDASIGRVVSHPAARGRGFGAAVMRAAIDFCQQNYPEAGITLSAQSYLHDFYQRLGFANTGKFYLEDDIPHQQMRRPPDYGQKRRTGERS